MTFLHILLYHFRNWEENYFEMKWKYFNIWHKYSFISIELSNKKYLPMTFTFHISVHISYMCSVYQKNLKID